MGAVTNPTAKPSFQPAPLLEINHVGLGLVFLTPALGGFLYGFDIGATSFVLAILLKTDDERLWWSTFPKVQQGLFVSALSLGALVGSHLVLMYLSHIVGRRMEIRICSILYIFGTFLNVLSGTTLAETNNYWWGGVGFYSLFLGRLLFGVGVGFIMHGVSILIIVPLRPLKRSVTAISQTLAFSFF
jgi:MFS family permease